MNASRAAESTLPLRNTINSPGSNSIMMIFLFFFLLYLSVSQSIIRTKQHLNGQNVTTNGTLIMTEEDDAHEDSTIIISTPDGEVTTGSMVVTDKSTTIKHRVVHDPMSFNRGLVTGFFVAGAFILLVSISVYWFLTVVSRYKEGRRAEMVRDNKYRNELIIQQLDMDHSHDRTTVT